MNPSNLPNFSFKNGLPQVSRRMALGGLIILALLAFETFNYGTTVFALRDLLGELTFAGVSWAVILATAFCGLDFAGIARLFTPEADKRNQMEAWYLFGAWMLAATMNAMLTWWGVSLAILNSQTVGASVIDRAVILKAAPIFVAVLVWLIRVLIIGTISTQGDRIFNRASTQPGNQPASYRPVYANQPKQAGVNQPVLNSQRAANAAALAAAQAASPATVNATASARSLPQMSVASANAQVKAFHPTPRPSQVMQNPAPVLHAVTQPEPEPSRRELSYVPVQIAEANPRANTVKINEPSAHRDRRLAQDKKYEMR